MVGLAIVGVLVLVEIVEIEFVESVIVVAEVLDKDTDGLQEP